VLHDEVVRRASSLSSDHLELLKQPLLVQKDLFSESPLLRLFKNK
jgi:hypothetical protein